MWNIWFSKHLLSHRSGCTNWYEVVTTSWYHWWYVVVMMLFWIALSCLKVWIRSCTCGYAVALLHITWVCSCMVISHFSPVYMMKSVQLLIILCNCISWRDNFIPIPTPYGWSVNRVRHMFKTPVLTWMICNMCVRHMFQTPVLTWMICKLCQAHASNTCSYMDDL